MCSECGQIVGVKKQREHLEEAHKTHPVDEEIAFTIMTVGRFKTLSCMVPAVFNRLRKCVGLTMQLWEATSDLERMIRDCRGDKDSGYDGLRDTIEFMAHACDDPHGLDLTEQDLIAGLKSHFDEDQ